MEDVETVKITKVFKPEIVTEQTMFGDWEVWARYAENPQFDCKLATAHYNYALQDNSGVRRAIAAIATIYGPPTPSAAIERAGKDHGGVYGWHPGDDA